MSTTPHDKPSTAPAALNCMHTIHDGVVRAESYAGAMQTYLRCIEQHVFGRELENFEKEAAQLREIEMELVRLGKEQGNRAEELRSRIFRASMVLRSAREVCRGTEMEVEEGEWGREDDEDDE